MVTLPKFGLLFPIYYVRIWLRLFILWKTPPPHRATAPVYSPHPSPPFIKFVRFEQIPPLHRFIPARSPPSISDVRVPMLPKLKLNIMV